MVEQDLLYAYQGLKDTTKGEESVEDHPPTSITQGASNLPSDEDMEDKIKLLDPIGVSFAYPDGQCALPAAPHRTRTAVRAVGSAPGQAHWPPPQAGATSGRWPTVLGVTDLIACAQVGPIRTPGGPSNP